MSSLLDINSDPFGAIGNAAAGLLQGYGAEQSYAGKNAAADAIQAAGVRQKAMYQKAAEQKMVDSGQQIAAGTNQTMLATRDAGLLASKLIAAAGASGGTGPQIERQVATMVGNGAYNGKMAMYNAESAARKSLNESDALISQGDATALGAQQKADAMRVDAKTGLVQAAGAAIPGIVSGAASLFQKYWPSGSGADTTGSAGQWSQSQIDANATGMDSNIWALPSNDVSSLDLSSIDWGGI